MTHRNATLQDALAEARDAYARRRPESLRRHLEAAEVMPGGNTRSVLFHGPFPFTALRGEGCRIEEADGHSCVNMAGEYTAGLFGHSHPAIRAAVLRALDAGVNLTAHNGFEARFARAVQARFPAMERLRFTNSGTEANLLALACATIATGRRTILGFRGGYHGGLLTFSDAAAGVNVPHRVVLARYNDLDEAAALARDHAAELAAIIVEPMLGSGGCIPAAPGFLAGLRALADETGALLVFDEVMTSRLAPGGAQEIEGVRPDLMSLGKYVGGGMSFGAFGGRAGLMAMFDPRRPGAVPHAGTFNNNTLTMSAGIAALEEVFTPDACRALNARGDALREGLRAAAARAGVPVCVTGRGSMMCLHPRAEAPRDAAEAASCPDEVRELLFLDLLERGFYLARRGMVALSLAVGQAECDGFVAAVEEVLSLRGALLRDVVA